MRAILRRSLLGVIASTTLLCSLSRAQVPPKIYLPNYWESPFDHDLAGFNNPPYLGRFIAVHMSLIPKGAHRGMILVWDYEHQGGSNWSQRWSIIDPVALTFENHELDMPAHGGDLFCSAHCWTANGDLFVAGGTSRYPEGGVSYQGGKLAYLYQPDVGPDGTWARQADLAADRFYP